MNLTTFQRQVKQWRTVNFGDGPAVHPLLGVVEELGELVDAFLLLPSPWRGASSVLRLAGAVGRLAHATLKTEQGIRGSAQKHELAAKDAVGDLLVYLADLCGRRGWDMEKILDDTWAQVSRRDWRKNPAEGSAP